MFDKVSLIMGILGFLFVQVFSRVNVTLEAAMSVGPFGYFRVLKGTIEYFRY